LAEFQIRGLTRICRGDFSQLVLNCDRAQCTNSDRREEKKVKIFLFLINEALNHKDVWGSASIAPLILTSALDEIQLTGTCPDLFTARTGILYIYWIRGWVNPEFGLGLGDGIAQSV
jgi:hypothetical protein